MPPKEKFFETVLELLRANPRGQNISDIVEKTGVSRFVVPHYVQALVDLGLAELVEKGKMKTYYYVERKGR